jgi:excisionase family DNA binding protein
MDVCGRDSGTTSDRRFLSRREVARLFDVSAHTVYRWTREGRLPYVLTPGGRRRYPREEIERLAASTLRVRRDQGLRREGGGNRR